MKLTKYSNRIKRVKLPALRLILNDHGTLLVYMVVVILIFGVLGVSLVSLFSVSTSSSATPNDAKRARYIAESGIRYALSEIRNSDDVIKAAELLNTTAEFKLGKQGSFTARAFSPGITSAENKLIFGSGTLTLNVPYSGEFPTDFNIPNSGVSLVDWLQFSDSSSASNRIAAISGSTKADPPKSVTLNLADDFFAVTGDRFCFALLATDGGTISRGNSIYVNEAAADFFPVANGAIRVTTATANPKKQYDYFYEERIHDTANNRVELTNIRQMPGETWDDIGGLQTTDYVILSPFNFRLYATGKSDQIEVEIGQDKPVWALAEPTEFTIYMRELLDDKSVQQFGDVVRTQQAGDKKIELGRGNTGTEGFGDLWYGGEKSIGGNANFCIEGRCKFGLGIRAFFTTDVIPNANGGQGFSFALISGGPNAGPPVNTKFSAGGDFQLPELLAYGGASLKSDASFLDGSGDGLLPPKMALEFDTLTDFNTPLDYCTANNLNLIPGSRNDPQPEGADRDVLQYVFWGSDDPNDLDLSCRSVAKESYDDNRHDAEGDQVAENFVFPIGAPIRSEPTYDPTDGTVYFGSDYNGTADFWAVNTDDGTLKWRYNAANRDITSKPVLDTIGAERFVYFSAADDLYKLKADPAAPPAGESVWLRNLDNFEDKVSPVVDNNNHKIYIGSKSGERFYAYDSDGTRLWDKDLGNDIEATAVIDKTGGASDGNVYVGTGDDNTEPDARVYGFDKDAPAPNPPPVWPYSIVNNDISSRPSLSQDGSELYLVTDTGNAYAIFTASGAQKWSNTSDIGGVDLIDTAVSPIDGTIYAATNAGDLHALDPANGNEKWQKGLTGSITFSSPTVGPDGTIYIGTDGNRVYAINPDNSDKWVFQPAGLGDVRSTPEVGGDGVVYVGSNDGNLYALATVAVPRNYRNAYASGQQGYLTSADLDTSVSVADTNNWLDGAAPLTKGPWAVRTEITREDIGSGRGRYTLKTWIRQCSASDCSDIKGTNFQDTTGVYDFLPGPPYPNLPFKQIIELEATEHEYFERFLFGFTTAASGSDTQIVEIRDFQLTFIQSDDETITSDAGWSP